MNEKYMICDDGFKNVELDGEIIGFNILLRIPYYRGIPLSMVEIGEIKVDGEIYPLEDLRFKTSSGFAFSPAEMTTVSNYRWDYGEKAVLTVLKKGGLRSGKHHVEVKIGVRVSYLIRFGLAYSQAWADLELSA